MILVGTPTTGKVYATMACDLWGMLTFSRLREVEWRPCVGSVIANNRTRLVHEAVKAGASHLLFIDSDMRFPHDTLERLLAHEVDVIGAVCRQRTAPELTNAVDTFGEWVESRGKTGIQEVSSVGFGVVLLDCNLFTSPLRQVPPNVFATVYSDNGPTAGFFDGEDVGFCRIARECGFHVWVDHDLSRDVRHSAVTELEV